MDAIKNLLERRSVRSYKPDMVPKDVLEKILEVGTYAPTARGRQLPIIVMVTDKAVRDRLSALNAQVMGTTNDPFYGAPVVAVVLVPKDFPTRVYDGSLVMGQLMLAAHAEGVASCWIHRAKEVFETEEGKAILAGLGIEGEWEGIGNCILGYAAQEAPEAQPRKQDYIYWIE